MLLVAHLTAKIAKSSSVLRPAASSLVRGRRCIAPTGSARASVTTRSKAACTSTTCRWTRRPWRVWDCGRSHGGIGSNTLATSQRRGMKGSNGLIVVGGRLIQVGPSLPLLIQRPLSLFRHLQQPHFLLFPASSVSLRRDWLLHCQFVRPSRLA